MTKEGGYCQTFYKNEKQNEIYNLQPIYKSSSRLMSSLISTTSAFFLDIFLARSSRNTDSMFLEMSHRRNQSPLLLLALDMQYFSSTLTLCFSPMKRIGILIELRVKRAIIERSWKAAMNPRMTSKNHMTMKIFSLMLFNGRTQRALWIVMVPEGPYWW